MFDMVHVMLFLVVVAFVALVRPPLPPAQKIVFALAITESGRDCTTK